MRKIFCILLMACILLTAAGCNGGNLENTTTASINGSGKADSISPDTNHDGYADDDVAKIAAFLRNSKDDITNAEILGWTIDDPATWEGVTWTYDEVKRLLVIKFSGNPEEDAPLLSGMLNLSDCTALVSLDCEYNQLFSLDVSGCTALEGLVCGYNRLTALNVSDCAALTWLDCKDNQLDALDVSDCMALESFDCDDNQLTALDVSGYTALERLSCRNNQLTTLDVSGCTALEGLFCGYNRLTTLNVSGCAALTSLDCKDNQLDALDVSGCTALTWLSCRNNRLTTLDVSDCIALEDLNYDGDQLAALDVSEADTNNISFQYTEATPEWKQIRRFGGNYDFTLVEDGQSVLHLIYTDYSMRTYHCFQKVDGNWTEPELIVDISLIHLDYWAGIAPDGSLCFAWKEGEVFQNEFIRGFTDVLHIKRYKDGQWRDEPKTYDFKGAEGLSSLHISWFDVAFDAQGEPHFFYLADGDYFPPESDREMPLIVGGLFLDETQLTQLDITRQKPTSLVQGVGDLSNAVYFYIDGGNVYHLLGCDENSLVPGSYPQAYTRYLHSYSRDGGETWEGPAAVFDGGDSISRIAFAASSQGNLNLMAYCFGSDQAALLTATLKPDNFEAGATEGYFGGKQMGEDLWELPYEEKARYNFIHFQSVLLDGSDRPHYLTGESWSDPFWDMTQINGNAWAIRDIKKPEEGAERITMFLRRNGNFILLAKATKEMEAELYYTEIPADR